MELPIVADDRTISFDGRYRVGEPTVVATFGEPADHGDLVASCRGAPRRQHRSGPVDVFRDALQMGVIEQVPGGRQLGKDDQVGGQLAGPGDRRFQRFATGTVVRGVDP